MLAGSYVRGSQTRQRRRLLSRRKSSQSFPVARKCPDAARFLYPPSQQGPSVESRGSSFPCSSQNMGNTYEHALGDAAVTGQSSEATVENRPHATAAPPPTLLHKHRPVVWLRLASTSYR